MQSDLANLKPLNPNGLAGFSKFRDPNEQAKSKKINGVKGNAGVKRENVDDSDDEDLGTGKGVLIKTEGDDTQDANGMLSPEDARRQAELVSGVQKIKVGLIQ